MIAGCVIKDPQTTLSDLPFYQPYDELRALLFPPVCGGGVAKLLRGSVAKRAAR